VAPAPRVRSPAKGHRSPPDNDDKFQEVLGSVVGPKAYKMRVRKKRTRRARFEQEGAST